MFGLPVVDKWVYVFKFADGVVEWHSEYHSDASGNLHAVDLLESREKERDSRPLPNTEGSPTLTLPITDPLTGKQQTYAFLAHRSRLPLEGVRYILGHANELLPNVNLTTGTSFFHPDDPSDLPYIPCVDPLEIAASLSEEHRTLRDFAINFRVPNVSQTEAEQENVRKRNQRLLLAQLLESLLDADPEDDLDLRDDLRDESVSEVKSVIREYELEESSRLKAAEHVAVRLCKFLEGELWRFMVLTYALTEDIEQSDFHIVLTRFGAIIKRLNESAAGKLYISNLLDDRGHFIHKYVIVEPDQPQGPDKVVEHIDGVESNKIRSRNEKVFGVIGKSLGGIVDAWQEITPVYVKRFGTKRLHVIVESINFVFEERLLEISTKRATFRHYSRNASLEIRRMEFVQIRMGHAFADRLGGLLANPSVFKARRVLAHLKDSLAPINLGLALNKLNEEGLKFDNVAGAVSALAEVGIGFNQILLGLSKKTLAKIGAFCAVVDLYQSLVGFDQMRRRNDYSAAAGYLGVAAGSAIGLLGAYLICTGGSLTVSGIGAVPGVVIMAVGAVVSAVGWLVAVFTEDAPLELFVAHCEWGEDYGQGNAKEPWSIGAFKTWRDNIDRQLQSLFQLISAFEVEAIDRLETKIQVGCLAIAKSNFEITFDLLVASEDDWTRTEGAATFPLDLVFATSTRQIRVQLDCETGELSIPPTEGACVKRTLDSGQTEFLVTVYQPSDTFQLVGSSCSISLRQGDFVIPSAKPVSIKLLSGGTVTNQRAHSWSD